VRKHTPIVLLFLALLSGGMAAYMASGWLKARAKQSHAMVAAVPMVPVVAAAKDITPGSILSPELLKVEQWPKDKVIAGSADDIKTMEGRVTRYPLFPGEIILETKLAPKGSPGGMAGIIQNDYRAVTIKVDEASGVAGFIMPGDRVDVLLTLERHEFKDDPMTQIALQNLLVLGKGQDIEKQKNGEQPKVVPTVTLQVTPDQGEKLALAAKEGHITLALRGYTENAAVITDGVRTSALLRSTKKTEAFEAPIASPTAEAPKKPSIEVLRGITRETVNF
jgi:pilus assembly protein CpaB